MNQVTLTLEPAVALFYTRIALSAGKSLEQVLSDALFKLAGELSWRHCRSKNNFQKHCVFRQNLIYCIQKE